MTTLKSIEFFNQRPDQLDSARRFLVQAFSQQHGVPITEETTDIAMARTIKFAHVAVCQLDYWHIRIEFEWLVANVTDDGLAYFCKQLPIQQPTLQSRTPYKTMFTLIRDQLRERFPFPEVVRLEQTAA